MPWHAHTGPYQAVHKAKICLLIDIPCLSWPCSSGPVLPNILHPPVTRRARRSLPLVTCEDRGVACCQPYGLDSDSWLYPKISQNYIYIYTHCQFNGENGDNPLKHFGADSISICHPMCTPSHKPFPN